MGGLGLLLCVAGVALAAFSLNLDFASIEQGINEGLPAKYSWVMAMGLQNGYTRQVLRAHGNQK